MKIISITSGYGGDFLALLKAQKSGLFRDIEFQLLISTISNSMALEEAKKTGIKFLILDVKKMGRKEFNNHLEELLIKMDPDLICLCGFRYFLDKKVVSIFSGRILNSHPSLLPAFPGLVKKEAMLDTEIKILGATVHIVDEGMDTGPPIIQAAFPNPGMRDLTQALNLYRQVQNIIYAQAVRNLTQRQCSKYIPKELLGQILFNDGIMFVPSIDEDILRLF